LYILCLDKLKSPVTFEYPSKIKILMYDVKLELLNYVLEVLFGARSAQKLTWYVCFQYIYFKRMFSATVSYSEQSHIPGGVIKIKND
jgi:hypothetical protein